MRRQLLTVCLVALFVLASTAAGAGGPYSRVVVVGDSLSDSGNAFVLLGFAEVPPFPGLIPDAPYARGGLHFSNGETWVEQLAKQLHLGGDAGPALRAPGVFSNYAVGGARARPGTPFDLTTQVGLFLADLGGAAPSDALYVVWLGGNDLRDAVLAVLTDSTLVTSFGIVNAAVTAIGQNLTVLASHGARTFLVPNAPDVGIVPALQGTGLEGVATLLSAFFNAILEPVLAGLDAMLGITVVRVDVFTLFNQLVAHPETAGLVDVHHSCITPDTVVGAFCGRPDEFLFWDGIHPTRATHAILADEAHGALLGP